MTVKSEESSPCSQVGDEVTTIGVRRIESDVIRLYQAESENDDVTNASEEVRLKAEGEANAKAKQEGKAPKELLSHLSNRFLTLDKFGEESVDSVKMLVDIPSAFRYPVGMKPPVVEEGSKKAEHGEQAEPGGHFEKEVKLADVQSIAAFIPSTATFFAIYFTMTALHGLHVLGGALVLGYFALFGRKMWQQEPERLTNRVEVAGLFWHFVDLVWIFLFPVVYLL
jgi:hypothetical protein